MCVNMYTLTNFFVNASFYYLYSSAVFVFTSPLFLTGKTFDTRCHMKGIHIPSHLQSFAGV